jgi:hypothetical protein
MVSGDWKDGLQPGFISATEIIMSTQVLSRTNCFLAAEASLSDGNRSAAQLQSKATMLMKALGLVGLKNYCKRYLSHKDGWFLNITQSWMVFANDGK